MFNIKVIIWRRLVRAAGLLMLLLFLAVPADAASVRSDNDTEMVHRGGQRSPSGRSSHVRRVHHHDRGSKGSYNNDVVAISDDAPVTVPDGGSTLAMMAASTALLLLGYHRLRCKRLAA